MAITPANDTENVDFPFEEEPAFDVEGTGYSMRELMEMLYKSPDLIFTIMEEQIDEFKKGLITVKGKDNAKLKEATGVGEKTTLSFINMGKSRKKDAPEGAVDFRVKLGPRKQIYVLDVKEPADDF